MTCPVIILAVDQTWSHNYYYVASLEFKIIRIAIVAEQRWGMTIIKHVLSMGSWSYHNENYASKIDLVKSFKLMAGGKQHHSPLDQHLLLFFQVHRHYPLSANFTQ